MTVPHHPPPPTAPAVREHRRALEARLVDLRAGVAEVALAASRKAPGAARALIGLRRKIANVEFELAANAGAYELAQAQDRAAVASWRDAVRSLPPEEAIEGIGGDNCCRRCTPHLPGGCVLTAACPTAGAQCWHPIKQKDLFYRDEEGKRKFPFRQYEQATAVFDAACRALKVEGIFA